MRKAHVLIFCALLIAMVGCSKAGIKEMDIYKAGQDQVALVWETDKAGVVVPKNFSHPHTFTRGEIEALLSEVTYQEYSFFKWRHDKKVFIESERQKLSAGLVEAFGKADSNHWVRFAVTAKKRDFLLPTRRLTDGYMWVKDGKFVVVLGNLNYEIAEEEDPYYGDPRNRFSLGSLRLTTKDGITAPKVDAADPMLKREHGNWVELDINMLLMRGESIEETPEAEKPAVKEPETPEKDNRTLEERLEELKSLLDKGLISEEDYERKKKELLEQL